MAESYTSIKTLIYEETFIEFDIKYIYIQNVLVHRLTRTLETVALLVNSKENGW